MKKVAVVGHFAVGFEYLDGQTVKTKVLTQALCKAYGEAEILKVDTHNWTRNPILFFAEVLQASVKTKNVVILPAHNGLRILAPLVYTASRVLHKCKLHYVVIGGWLPEYLEGKPHLKKVLQKFDGIYVETRTMKAALEKQGFSNVLVMPNCKELTPLKPEELINWDQEPYKLCTFSRVMKEKGIADAVDAVKAVNEQLGRTVYELDIYGQIDSNQTEWFADLQKDFPEYVQYKGQVPFDKSVETLKNYFALLFPTYYDGEGFAGTLLDAMASGTPVIASAWKYNPEIVKEGQTGILYPVRDQNALVDCLHYAYQNVEKWNAMLYHCLEEAKKYQPEEVLKVIVEKIEMGS